ncbi:MAG: ATP-binding protein [Actinomycetota bacterium]
MTQALRLSRQAHVWILICTLAVAGAAMTLLWVRPLDPIARPFGIPWVLVAAGYYVTESAVLHVRFRGHALSFSMSELPLVVGLFFLDPLMLVASATAAEAAAVVIQRRQAAVKAAFNIANSLFEISLAILIFYSIVPIPAEGPGAWGAAFASGMASSLLSVFFVSVVISLATGDWSIRRYADDALLALGATVATVCLGMLAVELARAEPLALILLLAPLALAYAGFRSLASRDDERRRAEEEITRSQEQLQAILNHSPSAIYVKDRSGAYVLVNSKFAEIVGRPPEEIVGRSDLDLFPEQIASPLIDNDRQVLATGRSTSVEEVLPEPDGGKRVYLSVKFPLLLSADGSLNVCGISSDVTERKKLEERLRQGEKMQAIGHLAGGVAHDFNNLLAVIRNYAEFVGGETEAPQDMQADIQEIIKASDRGADLTRQLLTFSRRDLVRPVVMDVNTVVSEMQKMLGRTLGENIHFRISLAEDLPAVRMDPGQLEQVLLNLAVNARDAMPRGGDLVIRTDREVVEPGGDVPPGEYVVLEVSDNGAGMSREVRANAFEPFFTTKGKAKGTGLGLATVYGIVQQARGWIDLESSEGEGTTFLIRLPATDEKPASATSRPPSAPSRAALILVTEDEQAVRSLVARILTSAGYEVMTAASGEEALALLQESDQQVDLLLTDVVLPNMPGYELAAKSGLKTVFMSGYSERPAFAPGGELPPDVSFVQKPFSRDQLLEQVALALDDRGAASREGRSDPEPTSGLTDRLN